MIEKSLSLIQIYIATFYTIFQYATTPQHEFLTKARNSKKGLCFVGYGQIVFCLPHSELIYGNEIKVPWIDFEICFPGA